MTHFAVINEKNYVETLVVCESKEIAESVTGKTCIEYTKESPAWIGSYWTGSIFTPIVQPTVIETPIVEE